MVDIGSYRKDANLQVHDVDDRIHPVYGVSDLAFQLDVLPRKGVWSGMAPSRNPLSAEKLGLSTPDSWSAILRSPGKRTGKRQIQIVETSKSF